MKLNFRQIEDSLDSAIALVANANDILIEAHNLGRERLLPDELEILKDKSREVDQVLTKLDTMISYFQEEMRKTKVELVEPKIETA
mgnify:FL=1